MIGKIFLAIVASLLAFTIFTMYQSGNHGTWSTFLNSSESDCKQTLPDNMRLVYSQSKMEYAVEIKNIRGNQFLWGVKTDDEVDTHFEPLTSFSDSCKAKSLAMQYIREQEKQAKDIVDFK